MTILGIFGPMQLIILLPILLIPVIAIIDILRNKFTGTYKITWLVLVALLPFLGALSYILVGSEQKIKK